MSEFLNLAKELCAKMTLKEKIGQIPQTVGGYRAYGRDGSFLMLAKMEEGTMSTIKSFFEVAD